MIYPKGISGPDLEGGDIVLFEFEGASLEFILPKLPFNHGVIDEVCSIRDFRCVNVSDWDRNILNQPYVELAVQGWVFEDESTYDNVAVCHVRIVLGESEEHLTESEALLSSPAFQSMVIEGLNDDYENDEWADPDSPEYPSPVNSFFSEVVSRPHIDWLQYQLIMVTGSTPSPVVCIPISERFYLNVSFYLKSVHYPDRKNPYSDELLRKMEFDLFDDFLSYIHVHYSENTIEKIEKLKQEPL